MNSMSKANSKLAVLCELAVNEAVAAELSYAFANGNEKTQVM